MTDPEKFYNLRNTKTKLWYAQRANGKTYWKLFQPNSIAVRGGDALDKALEENARRGLKLEAVEQRADEKRRRADDGLHKNRRQR